MEKVIECKSCGRPHLIKFNTIQEMDGKKIDCKCGKTIIVFVEYTIKTR
jgi:hypothetical protein